MTETKMASVEKKPTWAMTYRGFDLDVLKERFDGICDPDDWRAPIDTVVAAADLLEVEAAIVFYTATVPECTRQGSGADEEGTWQVKSEGYRNGPAGP